LHTGSLLQQSAIVTNAKRYMASLHAACWRFEVAFNQVKLTHVLFFI
jgi:hypothetical protein